MLIEIDIAQNAMYKWGQEEGVAQGVVQGVAQGLVQGEAKLLTRVLEGKFGPLSGPIRTRIAGASVEWLDRWADRSVGAETLDEVFAD